MHSVRSASLSTALISGLSDSSESQHNPNSCSNCSLSETSSGFSFLPSKICLSLENGPRARPKLSFRSSGHRCVSLVFHFHGSVEIRHSDEDFYILRFHIVQTFEWIHSLLFTAFCKKKSTSSRLVKRLLCKYIPKPLYS